MRLAQKLVIIFVAVAMLSLAGCKKKKPALPPPQAQAPVITVPVQPPPQPPPPTATQPSTTPPATTTTAPATSTKPAATKPKPRHHAAKKTATTTAPAKPSAAVPAAPIAKNTTKPPEGTDASVQISADVPQGEAEQRKQDTNQLLDATEVNIRKIGGRSLNDTDQATMRQIRNYITQSRLAVQDGDLERAYNLATKANLLCNELVKRF